DMALIVDQGHVVVLGVRQLRPAIGQLDQEGEMAGALGLEDGALVKGWMGESNPRRRIARSASRIDSAPGTTDELPSAGGDGDVCADLIGRLEERIAGLGAANQGRAGAARSEQEQSKPKLGFFHLM